MSQSLQQYCNENNRDDLLRQWDAEANLPLTPETVTAGSSRKVWWLCKNGHHWQQAPWERTAHYVDCPVCAGKRIIPGVNDLRTVAPETAAEWDTHKNGDLHPEELSPYSHRKVWWKCRKCGHEWLAQVKSRTGADKCGCPLCAGKTVVPGKNDFASAFPELAAEWHPEKNGTLSPMALLPGSSQKVWWKCRTCGSEWQAVVFSRTQGSGCPVCTGKKVIPGINDLASRHPAIAAEWHPEKNGSLTPESVTPQSNRSVWWVCEKGHEYKAVIQSRTAGGSGCPYCTNRKVLPGFNDLATLQPRVAAEWHPTLNGSLTPQDVTCGSAKKVWWQCSGCGYEWKAIIFSRAGSQRCGCPACAGKVKVIFNPAVSALSEQMMNSAH